MSETSEDMEAYAALYEASLERNNNKLEMLLQKIASCELSKFNDQQHMINYMKKLARIALKECGK
jgi:hypothetical protein